MFGKDQSGCHGFEYSQPIGKERQVQVYFFPPLNEWLVLTGNLLHPILFHIFDSFDEML